MIYVDVDDYTVPEMLFGSKQMGVCNSHFLITRGKAQRKLGRFAHVSFAMRDDVCQECSDCSIDCVCNRAFRSVVDDLPIFSSPHAVISTFA